MANQVLKDYFESNNSDPFAGQAVISIQASVDRAAKIINNMQSFARVDDNKNISKIDLADPVEVALSFLLELEEIHKGSLMKPFNVYALILAIFHIHKPINTLLTVYQPIKPYKFDRDSVVTNLSNLSESLENTEDTKNIDKKFTDFVLANLVKTNAAQQRKTRFKWFCEALEQNLL